MQALESLSSRAFPRMHTSNQEETSPGGDAGSLSRGFALNDCLITYASSVLLPENVAARPDRATKYEPAAVRRARI
jgi:hypothetical protein